MKVGFIGLGDIGTPMAERLTQSQFELTVFDVRPAATARFEGRGRIARSPAEMGRNVEMVGICVRHDADVTAVVTGAEGLLDTMPPGSVIAIHSTVRPATIHRLAEIARGRGIDLLDAAISGGPAGAAAGTLVCMVGAEAALLERIRPMLEAFSGSIVHAGGPGAGMALKLCNNLVTYMQLLAAIEGVGLAIAGGLNPEILCEIMAANGNMTTAMRQYLEFCKTGPARLGADAYWAYKDATAELAEKDLDFAVGFAEDSQFSIPGAAQTRRLIRAALKSR